MHNLPFAAQSLRHVWLFVTPWTAARQASLASTICWSLLKGTSVESGSSLYHPFMPAWAGFATLRFCLCAVPCETPTSLMTQALSIPPPLRVLVWGLEEEQLADFPLIPLRLVSGWGSLVSAPLGEGSLEILVVCECW